MPVSWASKDPDEIRSYRYSWLGRLNGAEISSATLFVHCGTITLSNTGADENSIYATVSGGADGEQACIVSRIVTTDTPAQTYEEAFTISINNTCGTNAWPSTSTKRQLVEMALEECALSGYEFDITPEETFSLLRRLDAMMAQWAAEGINLNYNAPVTFGGGDLEDYSGIPDAAIQGAVLSLAFAKAPTMRKTLSAETRARFNISMGAVRTLAAKTPEMGWARSTPAGAGNRWYTNWNPFMPTGNQRPCVVVNSGSAPSSSGPSLNFSLSSNSQYIPLIT